MCHFRKLSNSKSIGEQLVTTSCHYSRDEIIRSRQAQIIIKAHAVKAAREQAAVRRAAAKEIHMAAVRAKVTAVKVMKSLGVKDTAIKTDTTPKVVPARKSRKVRVQLISDVHPSHVETNIVNTSEVTFPELYEGQAVTADVNIETVQTGENIITPSPEELRATRIREMKALRAAKARLAVARLVTEEATRVEAAVMNADKLTEVVTSVAENVANVAAIKARRAAQAKTAVGAFHQREETVNTAIKEEITTLQTAVDCCVENFQAIGVIVRRNKAIITQPERVEMMDPEIEASVVIGLPSRRWVYHRLDGSALIPKRRRVHPHRRGWKWLLLERDGIGAFPRNLYIDHIWFLLMKTLPLFSPIYINYIAL